MQFCLAGLLSFAGARAGNQPLDNQFVVRADNERSTLDRTTGILTSTVDVRLVNLGGRNLAGPLHAVIETTPATGVEVVGALGGPGDALYGSYYVDLSPQLAGQPLAPGADVFTRLTFRRDRNVQMTYKVVPFGQLDTQGAPQLEVPGPLVIEEGRLLSFAVSATDPDNDLAALASESAVSNAVFSASASAGTLRFTPGYDQAGYHYFTFTARDARGLSDRRTVEVRVLNVNRPPVLSALPASTLAEGELLTVQLAVTDPDGDEPVLAALAPLPSNAVYFADSQLLVFAPDFSQAGDYGIPFEVSDGAATGNTERVDITVTDLPGAENPTNALTLVVHPVGNPTFAGEQRVTGFVNGAGGDIPTPVEMGIISGIAPVSGRRGQTLDVVVTGQAAGIFATAFGAGSQVSFGDGVQVQSVTVAGPGSLTARVAVDPSAALGNRSVQVITGNEAAYSLVAFTVQAAATRLSGRVLAPGTGQPVAGAIVTLEGTDRRVITGADGSFTFDDPPLGSATLLINAPNQDIIRVPLDIQEGQTAALGDLSSEPTVFNPDAPAEVSVLSVIGRGATTVNETKTLDEWRRVVTDALLLVGGTQAGVLDEMGNQLNPQVTGAGLHSLTPAGVNRLAVMMDRGGESVALADVLYAFSFGFLWEQGGAPTLQQWLDQLNQQVRVAWADPGDPENYLALMMFNRGGRLQDDPPSITAETRLNPIQAHLLAASLLAYATERAQGNAAVEPAPRGAPGLLFSTAWAQGPPAERRFTAFWRGFAQQRGNFVLNVLRATHAEFVRVILAPIGFTGGTLLGTLGTIAARAPAEGAVQQAITGAFRFIGQSTRVPEEPVIRAARVVAQTDNRVAVEISYTLSPSHEKPAVDTTDVAYYYTLYRYASDDSPREFVGTARFDRRTVVGSENRPLSDPMIPPATMRSLVFTLADFEPLPMVSNGGPPQLAASQTWLYTMTATKVMGHRALVSEDFLRQAVPWWTLPRDDAGNLDDVSAYALMRDRTLTYVSDYSRPVVLTVTPAGQMAEAEQVEVDPNTGDVYYMNGVDQNIWRVLNNGLGISTLFANAGFKPLPGAAAAKGLAIDKGGRVYTENASSDASFGGRIFSFNPLTGARDLTGALNYYSMLLGFARPVEGGPMDMGPGWNPGYSAEDLYQVDQLAGVVKKVPVMGSAPGHHRVGQPWATIPANARAVDLETSANGDATLLVERFGGSLLTAELTADTRIAEQETTELVLTVGNPGGATVSNVTPLPLVMTGDGQLITESIFAPPSANLPAGASVEFRAVLRGIKSGVVNVKAQAQGVDGQAETVGSFPAPPNGLDIVIESPLRLRRIEATPRRAAPGSRFTVTATYQNSGEGDITGVTPVFAQEPPHTAEEGEAVGSATPAGGPSATGFTLAPGEVRQVTQEFDAGAIGKLSFSSSATGVYVPTSEAVNSNFRITPDVSVSPLEFSLTVSPRAVKLDPLAAVTFTLSVTNQGVTVVRSVQPIFTREAGKASFANEIPPSGGPVDLNPGQSRNFTYTLTTPQANGSLTVAARLTATTSSGSTFTTDAERTKVFVGPVFRGRVTDFRPLLALGSPVIKRNHGVPGLKVKLEEVALTTLNPEEAEGVTDAQGNFILPVAASGVYKFTGVETNSNVGFTRRVTLGETNPDLVVEVPVGMVTDIKKQIAELKEMKLNFLPEDSLLLQIANDQALRSGVTNLLNRLAGVEIDPNFLVPSNPLEIKFSYDLSRVESLVDRAARGVDSPPFFGDESTAKGVWDSVGRMQLFLFHLKGRFDNSTKLTQIYVKALTQLFLGSAIEEKVGAQLQANVPTPPISDDVVNKYKYSSRPGDDVIADKMEEANKSTKKYIEDRSRMHSVLFSSAGKATFTNQVVELIGLAGGEPLSPKDAAAVAKSVGAQYDLLGKVLTAAMSGSLIKDEGVNTVLAVLHLIGTKAFLDLVYIPYTQGTLDRFTLRCQDPTSGIGGSLQGALSYAISVNDAINAQHDDITAELKVFDTAAFVSLANDPYYPVWIREPLGHLADAVNTGFLKKAASELEKTLGPLKTILSSVNYARGILHLFVLNPGQLCRSGRVLAEGGAVDGLNDTDAAACFILEFGGSLP